MKKREQASLMAWRFIFPLQIPKKVITSIPVVSKRCKDHHRNPSDSVPPAVCSDSPGRAVAFVRFHHAGFTVNLLPMLFRIHLLNGYQYHFKLEKWHCRNLSSTTRDLFKYKFFQSFSGPAQVHILPVPTAACTP